MPLPDPSVQRAADLLQAGRAPQAEPLLRRRLQRDPGDPHANRLLAITLLHTGQPAQAEFFARRAADLAPDAAAYDALGTVLAVLNKLDDSIRSFERGLALDPSLPSLHNGLGGALLNAARSDDAAAAFDRARELAPDRIAHWRHHAQALIRALRHAEALAVLREAVARFPGDALLRTLMVSTLNYADADARDVLDQHRALGALLDAAGGDASEPAPDRRDPARPLRVGFLSADFCAHPVAHFLTPLLSPGHPGLVPYLYSAGMKQDEVTRRLRGLGHPWRDLAPVSDAAAAECLRADRLDVLIDLGGHTMHSRVGVLAYRPAPLRLTYLGYPNTTGMRTVQGRIVDAHTDPPGAERWSTESLLRLDPCFLCYPPPEHAPPVAPPPGAAAGRVTFGSFNNPAKLAPGVLALWARVLDAVPGSRLRLKGVGLELPAIRDRVLGMCAAAGLPASRIEALPVTTTTPEHLAQYAGVDVALDTFPYHGTTTTCEALWMGVPVVTLAGDRHASRVGVSLLHAAGVPEWIADSPERYVEIAAGLAHDPAGLAARRAGQRERVAASVLCDQATFAARFEDALRRAWLTGTTA
jgi:predicted O-linked N-acetylglucosamine transferase (SPINDLY family)